MPKLEDSTPKFLQPYLAHGVELNWRTNDKNAIGDCVICSKSDKFEVEVETGKYRCWKCGNTGNIIEFIRWLWKESYERTNDGQGVGYADLQMDRGFVYLETLPKWNVCMSINTGEWLVPGYAEDGRLMQLYRRSRVKRKGEWTYILKPTATLGHHLHGVNLYDKEKDLVYLCEGAWDAMAWYETLGRCRETDDGLVVTGNPSRSLLAEANVLATPGCNVFHDRWLPLFADKVVCLLFDNDYPKTHSKTGKIIPSAGFTGMKRIAGLLASAKTPPSAIYYLNWGEKGYDPQLRDGTDLRDYFNKVEILTGA